MTIEETRLIIEAIGTAGAGAKQFGVTWLVLDFIVNLAWCGAFIAFIAMLYRAVREACTYDSFVVRIIRMVGCEKNNEYARDRVVEAVKRGAAGR